MEVKNSPEALEEIASEPKVAEYFTLEDIESLTEEMVSVVEEVLGNTAELESITFYNDRDNFFNLNDNTVHFGLAVIKDMIETWEYILTQGGTQSYLPGMLKKDIQDLVKSSLRRLAAHEAGHRVIDRHPVTEMGISQEEWGQVGISSLANALMDCRDDDRVMTHHKGLERDVKTGLRFKFGPNGPLDWPAYIDQQMLRQGYRLRFTEFDCEAIRWWSNGELHPAVDQKVASLLESHKDDVLFLSTGRQCVPKRNPSELEVKTKGQIAYKKVGEMYKGEYQKLIELDRDNQTIHQAISIVGLFSNDEEMPEKLKNLLKVKLSELDENLKNELERNLESQSQAKKEYKPIEQKAAETAKKTKDLVGVETEEQPEQPKDYFDILGPAVHVEELSDDLREWLKKLFEEISEQMQEEIKQQLLQALLQQLLENPEEFLKQAEDELNKKLRSPMTPPTHPTHEELEQMDEPDEPPPPSPILIKPGASPVPQIDVARLLPKELEEVEKWLDEHVDIQERIDAWKEAIYSKKTGGYRRTERPKSKLHGPSLVKEDIRKHLGTPSSEKIFLEKSREREKITLSILWRTQVVPIKESIKLFVFLLKIYEDEEIRRYLDLEILISQRISELKDEPDSEIPVILSFDDDPITDYEKILSNLMAIQKTSQQGGSVQIVEDATALKVQRERLLQQNPGSRMRFPIDLWDEAAVQSGSSNPLKAVHDEIDATQETFRNKAFCFVMNNTPTSTRGQWYGKDNFLAWNSTESLIAYLDLVCRTMIKYKDKYASHIEEAIEEEQL